jgi:enamine deaminase RidA (YjgF/YER057c/UK114 family)
VFVGGAGDFDGGGAVRHPHDLEAQIAGGIECLEAALAVESSTLADVVRLKAFYRSDGSVDEWSVRGRLSRAFALDPLPVVSLHPVPLQPFAGQAIQIQAIASPGWRGSTDLRCVTRDPPPEHRATLGGRRMTIGLRAGELIAVAPQTALDERCRVIAPDAGIHQTHVVMSGLQDVLAALGASFQDSIKKEGYYFGTTLEQWAEMAAVRASYFREPGPVATVVPCQALFPKGLVTKIELLAMRTVMNGFDKYIPRADRWPARVWDWPIPVPYRQGIGLRDMIWTGGQVGFEPGRNTGKPVHPGDLLRQTRFTMGYVEDILHAFGRSTEHLRLLVCYFASRGTPAETQAFLDVVAGCVSGPLPPITVVPQPRMHQADLQVEIWGVACA